MKQWAKQTGFTIVELLIVIVVIAILAAITIVAYTGIRDQTELSALQSTLSQVSKKVEAFAVQNAEQYPDTLSAIGVTPGDATLDYHVDNSVSPAYYCIGVTVGSQGEYFLSSTNDSFAPGSCDGLVGWWPLNSNTSDHARYVHTTSNGGATATSGQNDASGAFTFGAGNFLVVTNFDHDVMRASSFNSSWTLSTWASSSSNSLNEAIMVGRPGCHGGIYTFSNTYRFDVKASGCWVGAVSLIGPATDAQWRLLTATYSNGLMRYYVDGNFVGQGTIASMNPYGTTLYIGGVTAREYNGKLDDVRVYSRVLSDAEIAHLYKAGAY